MRLDFVDRAQEKGRLQKALGARGGTFCCLYGRRRCGKSRLLQEVLPRGRSAYYVADEREASLQRAALARAIGLLIPGFGHVAYPDWLSLLERWWKESPRGGVLALDEFPYLVQAAPELPSLLQKLLDQHAGDAVHLVICGSSQRMMQGLVLDATAPLYGRAREILNIRPLEAGWIQEALGMPAPASALEAFSVWGGVPLYWEHAADFHGTWRAVRELVLDPLGVFHGEPRRLLLDDMRDTAQATSILSLIGQGCHRMSEIAARLEKPATSLSRPLDRLAGLGLVKRVRPFSSPHRGGKRTLYRMADPFLLFWFRFIEPNISRLEARLVAEVEKEIRRSFANHMAGIWEDLARQGPPRLRIADVEWTQAQSWWGIGLDGQPLEVDVVSASADGKKLLVGEAQLSLASHEADCALRALRRKIEQLPFAAGFKETVPVLFVGGGSARGAQKHLVTLSEVLSVLK